MKYILIFLLAIGLSCKQSKEKSAEYDDNIISKNDSIKPTTTTPNIAKPSQIKICDESFRTSSASLNKFMASKKITYHDFIKESVLYYQTPQVFSSLFKAQSINCITSSSAGPYLSFELFYDTSIKAENIYDDLYTYNKNYESKQDIEGNYHDFFKRGLILILNKNDNIITMINFNPFYDNSLPKQVRQYFSKNKNEFDRVFMSTGVKTAEEFN